MRRSVCIEIARIVLPLGIFVLHISEGRVSRRQLGTKSNPTFIDFALFVMFFPQLIAGPIVHFGEVIPQFSRATTPPLVERYAVGITVFASDSQRKWW
jgi:D-alanyl-lipoteichoic acid acyltransferase DltB (MBOAT superfamily)